MGISEQMAHAVISLYLNEEASIDVYGGIEKFTIMIRIYTSIRQ